MPSDHLTTVTGNARDAERGGLVARDEYSETLDSLRGISTVVKSQVETVHPWYKHTASWLLETHRVPDLGDTLFLQRIAQGPNGPEALRLVFPPKVMDAIARQFDSLTAKSRSKSAKQAARSRAALGITPSHLHDPKVRAKAVAARKAKAAKRRARKAAKRAPKKASV